FRGQTNQCADHRSCIRGSLAAIGGCSSRGERNRARQARKEDTMMPRLLFAGLLGVTVPFVACVPWTVRPIEEARATPMNAQAFVDAIWSSKLAPAVVNGAVEAGTLRDAIANSFTAARSQYGHCPDAGACYFLVKGSGTVAAVDTQSRAGLAMVDI